ncbi:MAG TPA: hypothetical protein VFF79_09210 [Conexibacter sp.]|jgi:hypothetical protein|nr:hypothetical protein [Conexibacter sp.]
MELLWLGAQVVGWMLAGGLVVLLGIAVFGEAPEPPHRPDAATLDAYRQIGQIHEAALMRMLAVIWDGDA